uniref:Protein PFF0380w n=1 Tax=Anthurium amnicola TaxID=1678845 RepID=A0A1D1ZMA9_9ARAE
MLFVFPSQYALSGGLPQRNIPSQILNDQMFNMGTSNPASMVGIQQHATQSGFGNITGNAQNLQTGLNPQNLQTTINAQNLQPSMNTQSLQSGMNAQSLQPGVNTQNLQAGLNAQNLQSVMNSQNLQSVMNTQSLHPGMNTQNLQSGMVTLQNSAQNPSYQQQRQQSQQ